MIRRTLAIAAFAAAIVLGWLWWALARPGPPRTTTVEVARGLSATDVLAVLEDADLIPSPLAGRLYLELASAGRRLHWGRYEIAPRSRPTEVLEQILDGRVETIAVRVVEGSDADTIAAEFAAAGFGTVTEWREVVARKEWLADLAPSAASLEGFLFPDTYRFASGTSAKEIGWRLVSRFREVWREEKGNEETWGSPLEVITLASLVEAETSLPDERPRIAGVFINRLARGMLLQCDPTVVYALKRRGEWSGRLLRKDWQLDDSYNTYRYPGLPPGPIDSPGRAALRAALRPEHHRYLYFVARPDGGHHFSTSLKEHNRAVLALREARR